MSHPLLCLFGAGLGLSSTLIGQQLLARVVPDFQGQQLLLPIDLDGDGADEILATDVVSSLTTFRNDGRGNLTRGPILTPGAPVALNVRDCVADVDGDGDRDVIAIRDAGTAAARVLLLRNVNGTLAMDPAPQPSAVATSCQQFYDYDGDQDLDLLLGSEDRITVLLNDGAGQFTTGPVMPAFAYELSAIQTGDLDGDGSADLVVSYSFGNAILMRRQGQLVDESASRMPQSRNPDDAELLDMDGDGDLDLIIGSLGLSEVYANDGSGHFARTSQLRAFGRTGDAVRVLNLDGDSLPDLAIGTDVLRNTGAGTFAPVRSLSERVEATANLDRDRFTDVVTRTSVRRNEGGRGFFQQVPCLGYDPVDIDGDGCPELLGRLAMWQHLGGIYRQVAHPLPGLEGALAAWADFDADGDLDAAVGAGSTLRLLRQNASHAMVADAQLAMFAGCQPVALDYDRDGDVDLVVGQLGLAGSPGRLLQNQGGMQFVDVTATAFPAIQPAAGGNVAVGDADGDGDLDLLFGGDFPSPPTRLYLNRGNGTFADATATVPSFAGGLPTLAQLDADPELEMLFTRNCDFRMYDRSGGSWRDVTATRLPGNLNFNLLLPFDADDDGDNDLLTDGGLILLNDGAGRFTLAALTAAPLGGVTAVDLDGDGDVDLAEGQQVLVNQERQLTLLTPMSAGSTATLEFVVERGFGRGVGVGLVAVGLRRLPTAIPLFGGRLFVDPNGAALLTSLSSVTGSPAQATFALPADPRLRGLELHFQGMVVDPNGALKLMNHVRAMID